MKIVIVHNHYQLHGGEDTVVQNESMLLEARGHEVLRFFVDNKDIKGTWKTLTSGLGTILNINVYFRLVRFLKANRPEVIHVHNFFPLLSPAVFLAARRCKTPIVFTIHNYRLICANGLLFRQGRICTVCTTKVFPLQGIRYACYRNSRIQTLAVVLMSTVHNWLGTWTKSITKVILLSSTSKKLFDASMLKFKESQQMIKSNYLADTGPGVLPREDFFLFVGRIDEERRISILFEAMKIRPFPLVVIGGGPLSGMVERAVRDFPQVTYLGFQSSEVVISYMKRARALLFTSLWFEGFPMTLLEALSSATPVICSRIGAPAEIIGDEQEGLLFEPGDAAELASKIQRISDPEFPLAEFSSAARKKYDNCYSEDANYKKLIEIYQDAVDQNKALFPEGAL